MNEAQLWLYDHYAAQVLRNNEEAEALKEEICARSPSEDRLDLRDSLDALCWVWGTEAFALGLGLGLGLMEGEREAFPD